MSTATVDPFYLNVSGRRIFAVHHRPVNTAAIRGHILCVPPFNEEMNRCRTMVSLQAQAFAQIGIGTLLLDLWGTGDSEGEYVEARWSAWRNDIQVAADWLNQQPGRCLGFWGIRLGAILAAQSLKSIEVSGAALMAWQPVIDGKQHFTQFLRMRVAAQMTRSDSAKETTSSMRDQLASGGTVEVAGYEIHSELAAAIDAARIDSFTPSRDQPMLWLEQAATGSLGPAPASQKLIDSWRASGSNIDVQLFEGPNFWQVAERAISTSAIATTTAWAKRIWLIR